MTFRPEPITFDALSYGATLQEFDFHFFDHPGSAKTLKEWKVVCSCGFQSAGVIPWFLKKSGERALQNHVSDHERWNAYLSGRRDALKQMVEYADKNLSYDYAEEIVETIQEILMRDKEMQPPWLREQIGKTHG